MPTIFLYFKEVRLKKDRGGVRSDCAKLHPDEVLRTSPKDILWTSLYGPLRNAKGHPLPTSWGHSLSTSLSPSGRVHMVLYVTPRDVPYWHSEDALCRRSKGLPIWYNMHLHRTYLINVQRTFFLDALKRFLYDSIRKAKKLLRDNDFCIWS